jgi:hypothetical protein
LIGTAAIAVAAWGYWRVSAHGDVNVAVYDLALKTDRRLYGSLDAGHLVFKDGAGVPLATARIDEPLGIVSMIHPKVGDCRKEEREGGEAWRACYEAQSQWLMTWARDVRSAQVKFDNCTIENASVEVEESRDRWWLWWIPAPHLDNSTSTHFSLTLWIDSARCRAASRVR